MIAIVDYGLGNLFSLKCSLSYLGYASIISGDKTTLQNAKQIILPGVGAFGDAMNKLKLSGLDRVIINEVQKGKSILGICLGMQLLFENGMEYGNHKGLGLITGSVIPINPPHPLKTPHMGWNSLNICTNHNIVNCINNNEYVYYVHSYMANTNKENIVAKSEHGVDICGIVASNNIIGMQFHPEKSGEAGLKLLNNFCKVVN